jgi:ligand-binding sensor domain-containing protein/two-component sensor histidine kinase
MRIVLIFIVLCCTLLVKAQNYSFVKYSNNEGLPQSQVTAIHQDSSGYLWIGTLGGLSRFNGSIFKNYTPEHGLYNNRVSSINGINDKLYIGHEGGISILHNDSLTSLSLPTENNIVQVKKIIVFNNRILIITNGLGLFEIDGKRIKPVKYLDTNQVPIGNLLKVRDAKVVLDELYLATQKGIYTLNQSNQIKTVTTLKNNSYSGITYYKNKIYTCSYNGNIIEINPISKEYKLLHTSSNLRYRQLFIFNDQIWLNAKNGVEKLDISGKQLMVFSSENGLQTQDINSVFIDREANIWFGSSGKGLLKLTGEAFTYFNKQSGLSSDLILSVLETKEGDYYFSSYDNGITLKEKKGAKKVVSINSQNIWCSLENKKGDILFGTSNGLYRLTNKVSTQKIDKVSAFTTKVSALYETEPNKIYIAGQHGFGILTQDSLTVVSNELTKDSEIKGFTWHKNTLYVLGQTALFKYTAQKLERIKLDQPYTFSSITKIGDKIFIGSEQGLYQLKENKLIQIYLSNKTSANNVTFLNKQSNNLYIGTNDGLFIFNIQTKSKIHFGINEGLIDLETNINSSYFDRDGYFWFGTSNGLMRLDLSKSKDVFNTALPLLTVANISLSKSNKDVLTYAEGVDKNGLPKNLKIPFKYNGLSVTLDGLYLSNPKSLKYATKLNDEEDAWSNLTEDKTINLASLSYGRYTLSAFAETQDGKKSKPLNFTFEILPPYYAKTWFIGLCLAVLLVLSLLLIKLNGNRIIKEQKRKQLEEKLRYQTRLSKLEQQSLNASMNRHFIFNSLNSIQYYINANDKLSANTFLTRFAKLIRQNLDSSNTKNGLLNLREELDRLALYMDLEKMRFSNKFTYTINIENNIDTEAIEVPGMLLQPFAENSIIHGVLPRQDSEGQVTINIKENTSNYVIEILDNGVGIKNSQEQKKTTAGDHNSQGMEITSKRISIMQKLSNRKMELIGPQQINNQYGILNGTAVIINISKESLDEK